MRCWTLCAGHLTSSTKLTRCTSDCIVTRKEPQLCINSVLSLTNCLVTLQTWVICKHMYIGLLLFPPSPFTLVYESCAENKNYINCGCLSFFFFQLFSQQGNNKILKMYVLSVWSVLYIFYLLYKKKQVIFTLVRKL